MGVGLCCLIGVLPRRLRGSSGKWGSYPTPRPMPRRADHEARGQFQAGSVDNGQYAVAVADTYTCPTVAVRLPVALYTQVAVGPVGPAWSFITLAVLAPDPHCAVEIVPADHDSAASWA